MKRTLQWYLDEAIARSGVTSDRALSEMLGKGSNAVNFYRKKNVLPNDDTMFRLAEIAGVDPYVALLDLNLWRSHGQTQTAYKKILEKISTGIFVISTVAALTSPAIAAGSVSNSKSVSVYYEK